MKDTTPEVVASFLKTPERVMMWASRNTESVEILKEFTPMSCLIYQKLKNKWPLSSRDALLNLYGYEHPTNNNFYLAIRSTVHDKLKPVHSK